MTSESQLRDEEREFVRRNIYRILTLAAVLLLSVGTLVYRFAEDWSWVDSFYFSAIAVTTVGFGDLVPSSDPTKLFTVFYIFSGVAIITSFLNERLRRHARSVRSRVSSSTSERGQTKNSG